MSHCYATQSEIKTRSPAAPPLPRSTVQPFYLIVIFMTPSVGFHPSPQVCFVFTVRSARKISGRTLSHTLQKSPSQKVLLLRSLDLTSCRKLSSSRLGASTARQ